MAVGPANRIKGGLYVSYSTKGEVRVPPHWNPNDEHVRCWTVPFVGEATNTTPHWTDGLKPGATPWCRQTTHFDRTCRNVIEGTERRPV